MVLQLIKTSTNRSTAPPKKSVKMDLGSFLADDSLGGGSWADEEVDMSSIGVSLNTGSAPAPSHRSEETSQYQGYARDDEMRRERKEFPIPDHPPFRARIGNLPWEVTESSLTRFFEDRMQAKDIISDLKLPVDTATGRLKGFGFVTFSEREILEEALNLSMTDFNGRKIFVNVAAPQRQDVFDMDWRSARGSNASGRSEEPDLDWGSARGSRTLPPRERSNRSDRPRREEPDLDWSSARGSVGSLPPRERSNRSDRPRREEPELDWGSARGSVATLPPRQRSARSDRPKKDDFDWTSARGSGLGPSQGIDRKPRKQEPELDWKRGQALEPRSRANKQNTVEEEQKDEAKPKKSLYDVLAVDDESEEEEEEKKELKKEETGLEKTTAKLQIDDSKEGEGWEVVGK